MQSNNSSNPYCIGNLIEALSGAELTIRQKVLILIVLET